MRCTLLHCLTRRWRFSHTSSFSMKPTVCYKRLHFLEKRFQPKHVANKVKLGHSSSTGLYRTFFDNSTVFIAILFYICYAPQTCSLNAHRMRHSIECSDGKQERRTYLSDDIIHFTLLFLCALLVAHQFLKMSYITTHGTQNTKMWLCQTSGQC